MDEYEVIKKRIMEEEEKIRLNLARLEESRRKFSLNKDKKYLRKIGSILDDISEDTDRYRKYLLGQVH